LDYAAQGSRARYDDSTSETSPSFEFDLPPQHGRQQFEQQQQAANDREKEVSVGDEFARGEEE
jgi:hypothetical protein